MTTNSNLKSLVEKFGKNYDYYKNPKKFSESDTRYEFINPLIKLLGWDLENQDISNPYLREVITENYSAETGRPDYAFTLSGVKKFFIEAKKVSINIEEDIDSIIQARKYGYSAQHIITVLTNFEYLIIFDASIPPTEDDTPNTGLFKLYHFLEYADRWEEVKKFLSRDTVYNGQFERNFDGIIEKGAQLAVDELFLKQINAWRLDLGNYLFHHHHDYPLETISDLTNNFINQIVFLRICEDRNLPVYHKLSTTLTDPLQTQQELGEIFRSADRKYNSGLFCGEHIIFDLNNEIILKIIQDLYYPKSPYVFYLIESNLLGQIYEMFLSEKFSIIDNNLTLVTKNDTDNRDIVSTPIEIVKYIVEKALKPLILGKSPRDIINLKIGDISCGSGVILVEAYDYLIQYCVNWYLEQKPEYLIDGEFGLKNLPFHDKKAILLSCIFGIDIDDNAVEISKFSLLLKLLENETIPSLMDENSLLPDLNENIKSGNSLIDSGIIGTRALTEAEKIKIYPFTWQFSNQISTFDAIIGNPPYVTTENMKRESETEFEILKKTYKSAFKQFDKYFVFVERALANLNTNGTLCFIIPNKFSKIKSGEKLRELVTKFNFVSEFVDFSSAQLFKEKGKTIYSSILFLKKEPQTKFFYEEVIDLQEWWAKKEWAPEEAHRVQLKSEILTINPWILFTDQRKATLFNKIFENSRPLINVADVFNGIQTSAERPVPIYWFSGDEIISETAELITVVRNNSSYSIEKSILKPFFKITDNSDKNLDSYDYLVPTKWIIFPYDTEGKIYPITIMSSRFPGTWQYLLDNYDCLVPKQITGNTNGRDVPHATADTWYHYGRIQALTAFINTPKLIVGVLTKNPLYLFDENDTLIASGGTAGYCAISKKADGYDLEFIQAVLTHPALDWLCSIIGSDFECNYYSRGTYVLNRLPIKNIDFQNIDQRELYNSIVVWARQIRSINQRLMTRNLSRKQQSVLIREKNEYKEKIRISVSDLYQIRGSYESIISTHC